MKLDEYQEKAAKLAVYAKTTHVIDYLIHGLNGESGEVAEVRKKQLRIGNINIDDATRKKLLEEAGDVLWYVSQLAKELDSTLSEVALSNLEKLEGRAEQGTLAVVSRGLPLEDELPDGTILEEASDVLWRVDPEGTHVDWFHHDGSVVESLTPSEKWASDVHRDIRSNNTIMLRLSRVR